MSLTLGGLDEIRTTRKRNPEKAQRAQSAFARRFYTAHPHACRACVGRYVVAWILFYVFRHRVWWDCELHHRAYRHKAGTEPNHIGCPLCEKHAGRSDVLRRKWEDCKRGQYAPLITKHRIWLLGYWLVGVPCWLAGIAGTWFAWGLLAAHVTVSVTVH
jgi:hypothetical protein